MESVATETYFKRLAQPKPVPPRYVEDRRSVYWVDKLPPQPPTEFDLSPRLQELVKSKRYHKDFKPDRPSPTWKVPSAALDFAERERLIELAEPKKYHKKFEPDRSAYTVVGDAAKQTEPTKRLCELAEPKAYDRLLIKSNSSWEWGVWKSDVPKETLNHVANSRLEALAESKPASNDYQGNRPTYWPVSEAAKNAQPTTRQHQLARPKTRTALDQDYDPYKVSHAARSAIASPRVGELATPIRRKMRSKQA